MGGGASYGRKRRVACRGGGIRGDFSKESKQGQEKVSAEVRGAPEQFVAVPRDVIPSGDYRRDALSHRLQSVT